MCVGVIEEFEVEAGLHQGSILSPLLFAIAMDRLINDLRLGSPWTMMFRDDIAISADGGTFNVDRWRHALERK